MARDEGDFLGEQFMQWFWYQIEEVVLMATLVRGWPIGPGASQPA